MIEKQEKRNRRIGLVTSTVVHGLLLLLFILSMAWKAPDPPLPEFGIELNFGLEEEGSGDIQPETPPATDAQQPEDPEVQTAEPVEEQPEEVREVTKEVVTSKQESDVVVKDEKEKPKEEKPKEEKPKVEYKKEEVKSEEKKNDSKGADQPVNQGDDKNKAGDKGDPKGNLDPNAAYTGKAGGGSNGDGMVLSMAGWTWSDQPSIPNLPDNEDGRIVFEIECDSEGDIVGIRTLERGLSLKAEQLLLEEIRKNSLVRTSGGQTPERSKGKVVFILKTR